MKLPVPALARGAAGLAHLGRASWRFRLVQASRATGFDSRPAAAPNRKKLTRATGRLEPGVYALWHEHLLPLAVLHGGQGVAVLVSRHRDGEILTRVLDRLGYHPVRGSTTRGGAAGLRALIEAGRAGHPVAFTPDGPRGPRRQCQPGIVHAAAATGLPIVPVGVSATLGWKLNSWDRFLVPAPGATVLVSYGVPLRVPGVQALEDVDAWAHRIGQAINQEIVRCEEQIRGRQPPSPGRDSRGAPGVPRSD